jgi:hypothetical protein
MDAELKYNMEKLLFRRQFILSPNSLKEFPWWKRLKIREKFFLTIHPDLNAYQVNCNDKSITLLGYILDPDNPQYSDLNILDNLLKELCTCDSLDSFFKCTYTFGGRWILIADDGNAVILFNDAAGLRQVYYNVDTSSQDIWCASQPGVIADILKLEPDTEALEFIEAFKEVDNQYWWPDCTSPYRDKAPFTKSLPEFNDRGILQILA